MAKTKGDGSELHRLTEMKEGYDPKLFNQLFQKMKPLIKKLVFQINNNKLNLPKDIIESYFYDKLMFVFNKYFGTCSKEHLQARIIRALCTYQKKLLRNAYGERAEYNQSLVSLEELYDNNKEDFDNIEETQTKENMRQALYRYMKEKLGDDEYLIFTILINPPEIFKKFTTRIPNTELRKFFQLPPTRKSLQYIADCRANIQYWIEQAKHHSITIED